MSIHISDEALLAVVSSSLDVPRERLSMQASRDSLEEWDSLAHIMLILAVEKEFGRKVSIHEIERIRSIQELKEALTGELSKRGTRD